MRAVCAGERRLHSAIPFLVGAAALTSMAFFMDSDPSAAFVSLLGATIVWGPAGVVYSLPATFLQACLSFRRFIFEHKLDDSRLMLHLYCRSTAGPRVLSAEQIECYSDVLTCSCVQTGTCSGDWNCSDQFPSKCWGTSRSFHHWCALLNSQCCMFCHRLFDTAHCANGMQMGAEQCQCNEMQVI